MTLLRLNVYFLNLFIALFLFVGVALADGYRVTATVLLNNKLIKIFWQRNTAGQVDTSFGYNLTEHQSHSEEPFHLKKIAGLSKCGSQWSITENGHTNTWNIEWTYNNKKTSFVNIPGILEEVPSTNKPCKPGNAGGSLCTEMDDFTRDSNNEATDNNKSCVLS